MTMTHRFPQDEFATHFRSGVPQRRPSFIAMVIAEWHKLVADVSRAFAAKRNRGVAQEKYRFDAETALPSRNHKPTRHGEIEGHG
jgi:hypothetical protein